MDGFDSLLEAIRTVPLPGAPPRLSLDGAAVGLSFLESGLRLNHVRRLTERITITEHRVASRTTEVDISLGMLDEGQKAAAAIYQNLTSHEKQGQPRLGGGPKAELPTPSTWIPVARISRTSAAPVDVHDAAGRKLPKLTQFETSRLLASGMYRLLRGILTGFADARKETELSRLLYKDHEPRWLIQAALLALLTDRNPPALEHHRGTTPDTVPGDGCLGREVAIKLLEHYYTELADYYALLNVALNDYLLVVAVDSTRNEHLLTYASPLRVGSPGRSAWSLARNLRADRRGYIVHYEGKIPAGLRSYHLVVETEHGVDVERMHLATDADAPLVTELTADLRTLAEEYRSRPSKVPGKKKILELELQTTLRRLADLLRRRRWDAGHAGFPLAESRLRATAALSWAATSGEESVIHHPLVQPDALEGAAAELDDQEMHYDLSLENDPVSNQAHAYWRRRATRSLDGAQINTRAAMVLRDTTSTGPISVFWYALSVAVITYLVACFAGHVAWPYPWPGAQPLRSVANPSALITVLLLVPGFLYTRLALPDRHTVTGYLRTLPRLVAHICIGAMAILSAAIAGSLAGEPLAWLFAAASTLPLVTAATMAQPVFSARWQRGRNHRHNTQRELQQIGAPRWVDGQRNDATRSLTPDVVFYSSGSHS